MRGEDRTDCADRETLGRLVAVRSVLERALNSLSRDQLRFRHDVESGSLADLRELWDGRTDEFALGILDELDRLRFRLRQKAGLLDIGQTEDAREWQLFCRKCEKTAVPPLDPSSSKCPECGGSEFLELI